MDYDYIIVGGGSAGCVIANRLSSRSANQVILIEAGKDYPPSTEPPEIVDSFAGLAYFNPDYLWSRLRVHLQPVPHNEPDRPPPSRYEQARIMGGGSTINGQMANRGTPADYDAWEARGAQGWGWEGVLPYFVKLESDQDFGGPLHGKDGPQGIRRFPRDIWPGFSRAFAEAFEAEGFPYLADQNGEFGDGFFPLTFNNVADRRVSAAMAYLDAETRKRPNLTIRAETQLKALILDGNRVTGVTVASADGGEETLRGREVILSAGAIHSPAMLMRAGIGPANHLKWHGIEVVADVPGVGQNLQDHPSVSASTYLKPEARLKPPQRRQFFVGLRYSSSIEECPEADMFVTITNRAAWHPLGGRLGAMVINLYKAFSTGQVTLASTDWRAEPKVEFDLLADQRDVDRLAEGLRLAWRLYQHPAFANITDVAFPTSYSERVRDVGKVTRLNWFRTGLLALMLDAAGGLRRRLIETVITQGVSLEGLLADRSALEAWIKSSACGIWHASCTCRMGADGDPMAVTDPACRVRGVEGLRVVDASVMPEVPRANTNLPAIMVGEKAADAILATS